MQNTFQKEIIINGIDISKYREHPRVLELRIIMIFNALATHYDNNIAMTLMRNLSDVFYSNWTLISGILNNWAVIRRMEKTNKTRYRQEVIFMGLVFGESRYYIADTYLGLSKSAVYRKSLGLVPDDFITQEWLDELDNSITICGASHYKLEAIRYVEGFNMFREALGNVYTSRT